MSCYSGTARRTIANNLFTLLYKKTAPRAWFHSPFLGFVVQVVRIRGSIRYRMCLFSCLYCIPFVPNSSVRQRQSGSGALTYTDHIVIQVSAAETSELILTYITTNLTEDRGKSCSQTYPPY